MPLNLINSGSATVNLVTSDEYLMVANTVLAVASADAIIGSSINNVDLVIDGYVASGVNAIDITGNALDALNTIYIGENGFVFGDSNAIRIVTGNYILENHGTVTAANGVNGSSLTSFTLLNHGTITATALAGTGAEISTGGELSVNYGTITGFEAVDIFNTSPGGTVEFDNYGSLISTGTDAINGDSGDDDIVRNFGTISGDVNLEGGDNTFTNTGSVAGDALFELGADTVINSGLIDGDVILGLGDDVYIGTGDGYVTGSIELGQNDDTAELGNLGGVVGGGSGNDIITGGTGSDFLYGDGDSDLIRGRAGDDSIDGGNGNDTLRAGQGDDDIFGGTGDDFIRAGAGEDIVYGQLGLDEIFGGTGADTFVFTTVSDSPDDNALRDVYQDFVSGEDVFDLTAFAGLSFVGDDAFSGTGAEIRVTEVNSIGRVKVFVDTDGDGSADMKFVLNNTTNLTEDDFLF